MQIYCTCYARVFRKSASMVIVNSVRCVTVRNLLSPINFLLSFKLQKGSFYGEKFLTVSRSKIVCKVKLINFQVRMELIFKSRNWSNYLDREILHQKQPHIPPCFVKVIGLAQYLQHSDKFYRTFPQFNLTSHFSPLSSPASSIQAQDRKRNPWKQFSIWRQEFVSPTAKLSLASWSHKFLSPFFSQCGNKFPGCSN